MGYGLCTSMHSSLELGMFLRRSYFFIIWRYDLFNVSGNRVRAVTACHPYPIFLEVPPGFFVVFYIQMGWGGGGGGVGGGHCARRSLWRPWKPGLRIVA